MSCVNSAIRYVEFKRMGKLKKMLIKGTDLGAGMVIRGSICQRLAILCDHMHSGGLIQLPLKSAVVLYGSWISLIKTSLFSVLHKVSPFGFQSRHPYGRNKDVSLLFH